MEILLLDAEAQRKPMLAKKLHFIECECAASQFWDCMELGNAGQETLPAGLWWRLAREMMEAPSLGQLMLGWPGPWEHVFKRPSAGKRYSDDVMGLLKLEFLCFCYQLFLLDFWHSAFNFF